MRALFLLAIFVFALLANETAAQTEPPKLSEGDQKIKIKEIDAKLANNIWAREYANYMLYTKLERELALAKEQANKGTTDLELENQIKRLSAQLDALKDFAKSPFVTLLVPPNIEASPQITNPLALFGGFSYLKSLNQTKESYENLLKEIQIASKALKEKKDLLSDEAQIAELEAQISEFEIASVTANTTFSIFSKKIDESIAEINAKITAQIKHSFVILGSILSVFLIGIVAKFSIHHYMKDNQKFYTINKFINISGFIIIVFILLFAYIENVNYLITILGFASAGLAIAMKDMFMSLLGWSVILAGGSFHVGDRIKVRYENGDLVGDIIDISLLRMTLYEDITLTTYKQNRRSGRIIFIPNNYIFTNTIANYTHSGMKTVWDGIDIAITFDSNHKKAVYIVKSIVRHYSKGFTDVAKTQMNKLRDQYSIKNTNVEPRIYTFLEPHAIVVSAWYKTNSYATLALRSNISADIIEAFNKENDIKIAYPRQTLYLGRDKGPLPSDEAWEQNS